MDIAKEQELKVKGMRSTGCAQRLTTTLSGFRRIDNGGANSESAVLHSSHPLDAGNLAEATNGADFRFTTVRERAR